jgi:hypothetical protein
MAEDEGGSSAGRRNSLLTGLPAVLTASAALVTATVALIGFVSRNGDGGTRDSGVGTTIARRAQTGVELFSPREGRVPWKTPIVIRYSNIGQDAELWLIERSDKYYPHPGCPGEQPTVQRAPGQQSGTWNGTIEIGAKDTPAGDRFELLVLLASERASQLLSTQIRGWCSPNVDWTGISELPDENAEVKANVAVLR